MNRYLSAEAIAATLFPGAQGLPLNRHVTPGMAVSDEAVKAVEDMAPVNAAAGLDIANRFPRSAAGTGLGISLGTQFPSNVRGDRAQAKALKRMFNNLT